MEMAFHMHGGPIGGEYRVLDSTQRTYLYVDDLAGRSGIYAQLVGGCDGKGNCFAWQGWKP